MIHPRHDLATLSAAFTAFCALQQPGYQAYAAARLPATDAERAVAHILHLLGQDWTRTVTRPNPAAYAWTLFTRHIAREAGTLSTMPQDIGLMRELDYTIDQIATLTGTDKALTTALAATRTHGFDT